MINEKSLTAEWYLELTGQYKNLDRNLFDKVTHALYLLEKLSESSMPFIFKGGTSLLLLLQELRRLSIDIDIIVPKSVKIAGGLKDALRNGYRLHPSFPEIGKEYESKFLFSAFLRRLPDRNRKDYAPIFVELGVTDESSDFDLLAITGGKLNSDSYEFVKPNE